MSVVAALKTHLHGPLPWTRIAATQQICHEKKRKTFAVSVAVFLIHKHHRLSIQTNVSLSLRQLRWQQQTYAATHGKACFRALRYGCASGTWGLSVAPSPAPGTGRRPCHPSSVRDLPIRVLAHGLDVSLEPQPPSRAAPSNLVLRSSDS